ncbi:MAG TPA: hypothetical protein VKJ47_05180 [Candidatus Binatia bacterium]|nr:hypothetical protein [Candidatus Binatia bacterium]
MEHLVRDLARETRELLRLNPRWGKCPNEASRGTPSEAEALAEFCADLSKVVQAQLIVLGGPRGRRPVAQALNSELRKDAGRMRHITDAADRAELFASLRRG